jgi:glycosyltransferase involved in cell wall biosynthesis
MNKMISIVTITFNNFHELKSTLESIPHVAHIQSIVINGGSCEETKTYLSHYSGVVLNERDKGIADAFNKGLALATGQAVMFLNSGDVLLSPNYLEKALEKIPEYDFIHSNIIYDDHFVGKRVMKPALCPLGRGMPYFHQSMIVKRHLFREIGGFNLEYKIAMDYDFVVRMEKRGVKGFYFQDEPTILMDGKGVSFTQEEKGIAECKRSLISHGLYDFNNQLSLTQRFTFYKGRMLLSKVGLLGVVKMIKKLKSS